MTDTASAPLRRTPLHAAHLKAGARMVPFGGWDMPVQYAGLKAEHEAVRTGAGVFDVSHMGEFRVTGPDALAFLQHVTPNDVSKIRPGRAQYNWLPNDRGGLVDDIYIYRVADSEFLVVVNASNIEKDWAHLNALKGSFDVQLTNESDQWALLAVQGPQAAERLAAHATPDLLAPKKNAYFAGTLFGMDVHFARTGYTGEDGYEVFVPADQAEALWEKLLETGIQPAGLGARDTLRLEAGFPLYGHEFSDDLHPLSTHYTWVAKDKAHHGREGLQSAPTQKLIGLKLEKVPVREGYPVKQGGRVVGHVTSGSSSPSLGHPIAMALVEAGAAEADTFEVEVRGKDHPATRTDVPFYRP
ncbi:glycine cleavage system aminomethyltransferase GcvT [Deinococcus ficus]|uniref:Aminomethyltransferase n=1 Tax=Deinococcus ficus TaxID=317577 RepID=A0A221ST87_9DEIO|nr:glycine cleavage system aminomethyltransferase GcvT [Deinococcus ficus]ASN79858.1 glycine cleavage system protein T [Deinococcus ficus]